MVGNNLMFEPGWLGDDSKKAYEYLDVENSYCSIPNTIEKGPYS